ncbi:hypothetical protein BKA83DRAFT_2071234 [Pisolithus microcarpus]|nr:hypothetical protein BKA83DRAFT_2071234 [Pisolithus microcarpus]
MWSFFGGLFGVCFNERAVIAFCRQTVTFDLVGKHLGSLVCVCLRNSEHTFHICTTNAFETTCHFLDHTYTMWEMQGTLGEPNSASIAGWVGLKHHRAGSSKIPVCRLHTGLHIKYTLLHSSQRALEHS